jgi:hypothetical protein
VRCCSSRRCDCVFATSSTVTVDGDGSDESPYTLTYVALPFGGRYFNFRDDDERDAYLQSPIEGDTALLRAEDRMYTWTGAAWVRTFWTSPEGRTGVRVRRAANWDVLAATSTLVEWDTLDFQSDAYLPTNLDHDPDPDLPFTTLTVPTGLGGLYACTAKISGWPGSTLLYINRSGTRFTQRDVDGVASLASHVHAFGLIRFSAGETCSVTVHQNSGSTRTFQNGLFEFWRIGL